MKTTIYNLAEFETDTRLFNRTELLVTVKSFDLQAIRRRYLESRGRSRTGSVERRQPSTGGLVRVTIDSGVIVAQNIIAKLTEARGIDWNGSRLAVSSENRIFLFDEENDRPQVIEHAWLSYVHTVRFDALAEKILVSSSGLDSILEFSLPKNECTWHWLAWEHGLEQAENPASGEKFTLTRNRERAEEVTKMGRKPLLIERPQEQHLPTAQRAAFINSAEYANEDQVLATLFHAGSVIAIDRKTGRFKIVIDGLARPHGGCEHEQAILVTNTAGGKVILTSATHKRVFDFSTMPGKGKTMKDLEWLQTSHASEHEILTIDSNRSAFVVFDYQRRKKCIVHFDPSWAVQDFIKLRHGAHPEIDHATKWFNETKVA